MTIGVGVKEILLGLKSDLIKSVQRNGTYGLLFSGGLDSAILAGINSNIKAITVSLKSYGEDVKYASSVVKFLNIEHYQKSVDIDEAIEAIPEVIKILKTFDPALPNDLTVYFGLKLANDLGIGQVMTGDGSDELFAGYEFMHKMVDLERYIQRISQRMKFSSNEIGNFFGIEIIQPFIDKDIINFALQVPVNLKLKEYKGEVWGKWILRMAFEDMLPEEIIWQSKRPLEYGSGMRRLREIISNKVSDEEFKENFYPITFISKEHFYYYKIYREVIGNIPKPAEYENVCPGCGAGISTDSFHCRVCGYVLDWRDK